MPFTPVHFGPHLAVSWPLCRHLDVVAFTFASVAVDVEPLVVMLLGLASPLHGYSHTLLFGTAVGLAWGALVYWLRRPVAAAVRRLKLEYRTTLGRAVVSGVLGVWFHVLVDGPLYPDIRPFFPWEQNPLYGLYGFRDASLAGLMLLAVVALFWWRRIWLSAAAEATTAGSQQCADRAPPPPRNG